MIDNKFDNTLNYVRMQDMKFKYYNLVMAYRKMCHNSEPADIQSFLQAAADLAETDILDILFSYSMLDPSIQKKINTVFEDENNYLYARDEDIPDLPDTNT